MKKTITLDVAKSIPFNAVVAIEPHTDTTMLVKTIPAQIYDYFCGGIVHHDIALGILQLKPVVNELLDISEDEFSDILP